MTVMETIKERWYLIVGIAVILCMLLLPISHYFRTDASDPDFNGFTFISLFYYYSSSSNNIEMIWELVDGGGGILALGLILILAGAALLIVAGIAKDNEKIQTFLPIIGVAVSMIAVIIVGTNMYAMYTENTMPLFFAFWQSSDRTYFVINGIGYFVSLGLLGTAGIKAVFYS